MAVKSTGGTNHQITDILNYMPPEHSIVCFMKPTNYLSTSGYQEFVLARNPGTDTGGILMIWNHQDYLKNGAVSTNGGYVRASFVDTSYGSWKHVAGVYSNSSRTLKAYVNGVLQSTVGVDAGTTNTSWMFKLFGWSGGYIGELASVAGYTCALTVDDVAMLAKGVSPRKVRPDKLYTLSPLVRTLVNDKVQIASPSLYGNFSVSSHPRIYP